MVRLSVYYPASEGAHFDHAYYEHQHRSLVVSRLASAGLLRIEMERGVAAGDGSPAPFVACGHLYFRSQDQVQNALTSHGAELLGDIPNYTNIAPVIQIGTVAIDQEVQQQAVTSSPLLT